ncbi:ABC transporter substrate-binding protein [Amycolatopsis suaedae]|uniref:ABC transporter substrate-binding protein n=1 Tax=Amycolatopsis suaedae TaxID=2510978 RepID=A0A4Q7J3Q6_9PSEU|nr:ABC transporter substrate-binding protein [Amycolatopsis suaedae]RZQ61276.1 ABC transporter substrate-binding protein [Amycolatopsis suaedae]
MSTGRLSRRGLLYGTAGAGLLLAGCGSGTSDDGRPAAGAVPGFPVTVEGKLGNTTVEAPPQRVVACGYLRDTDIALALGAGLVLSARHTLFANGMAAWSQPAPPTETVYALTA